MAPEDGDNRDSSMEIRFSLSVGYQRKRPDTAGDRLEARLDSAGLLLVGSIVVIAILWLVVPRLLAWLGM